MTIFLLFLAAYRITRLWTRDKLPFIYLPREAFVQRWGVYENQADKNVSINGRKTNLFMRSLAYLWECDWCSGVWIGAALVLVLDTREVLPQPWWLVWGATAAAVGLLAEIESLIVKKAE